MAHYTFDDADIGEFSSVGPGVSTGASGAFGEAYRFSGGAKNLTTIPAGIVPSGAAERTLTIWFNQARKTGNQDKILGYGLGLPGKAFDISLENGGITLRHFGGNITYGSGYNFIDSGWHYLALRVNPGAKTFANVDVFLNGQQLPVSATSGGGTGVALDTADSAFGVGTSSISEARAMEQGFNGWLDELKIYDRALSNQALENVDWIPESATLPLLSTCFGLTWVMLRRRR